MHKRFRRSADQIIEGENSSTDEASTDLDISRVLVRQRPANMRKYVRIQRVGTLDDAGISDSSSDEANSQDQENQSCLQIPNKYRDNSKALQLTPTNKFQPLSVTLSGKKISPTPSPTPLITRLNTANVTNTIIGTPPSAWHSLRRTLSTLRRDRRNVLRGALEDEIIECSSAISIEANLRSLVDKQQMPNSARINASSLQKRRRCVKGGYLEEYKRLMQKERMDRRSLNHNQRLGISPGQRVYVLGIYESFGVHMARVQADQKNESVFNVIVAPSMASKIFMGSCLELYFDLRLESALKLPNKELVFIQPNKLVLL